MLSKKLEKALNDQMGLEAYASYLYLSMASWFDNAGMEGCSKFMFRQSVEENEHMLRIYHYILEMDGKAIVPGIKQAPNKFKNARDIFKSVYAHEQKVTKSINDLVNLSSKEAHHATFNFLQWYVAEQMEEEALMRGILDRIKLIGNGPQSLYYIDKEIEKINQAEIAKVGPENA